MIRPRSPTRHGPRILRLAMRVHMTPWVPRCFLSFVSALLGPFERPARFVFSPREAGEGGRVGVNRATFEGPLAQLRRGGGALPGCLAYRTGTPLGPCPPSNRETPRIFGCEGSQSLLWIYLIPLAFLAHSAYFM